MAAPTGTRVQTWLKPGFAQELKQLADQDGRSVSGLIRHVLEHELATSPLGGGEATAGDGSGTSGSSAPVARAGSEGD